MWSKSRIFGVAQCDNPTCTHITGTLEGMKRTSRWFDVRSYVVWERVKRNKLVSVAHEREPVFCQDQDCQRARALRLKTRNAAREALRSGEIMVSVENRK